MTEGNLGEAESGAGIDHRARENAARQKVWQAEEERIIRARASEADAQRAAREAKRAEADRRRQEEEGFDLLDGLIRYAERREGEPQVYDPLQASLVRTAQGLMWRREGEAIIPGPLLEEGARNLLLRLLDASQEGLDSLPVSHLAELEQLLTQELLAIVYDPVTRKAALRIPRGFYSGRYERSGAMESPNASLGDTFRGHSIGRTPQGGLVIKPDADTVFTGLTLTLAHPDFTVEAEMLNTQGNPTDSTITAKPILRAVLTETMNGENEQTTLYRTREGLVVVCPDGIAKCYPDKLSARASVTRKPVIYLYPSKKTPIKVQLDYKGKLTNTYPKIDGDTWNVTASPDGTLQAGTKKYKYLFWDGVNDEMDWDWSQGFCVHKNDIDSFLEEKMEQLGLNFAEAQDFITYWAPMMKQNPWSLVSFQTKKYEKLAKLNITPRPDTILRIFMIFKKSEKHVEISEQKLVKVKRKGFIAVEWGGSNLDEQLC